jgi:hypothetical protein
MINSYSFAQEIEVLHKSQDIDYIDAVIFWCEKNNIELELIASLINKDQVLKSKIRVEAENLNIIKKGDRLPL